MKKTMKGTCVLLAAVLACCVGAFAGCGKKVDKGNTLMIEAVQLGYGLDWLQDVADGWSKKTGHKVHIKKQIGAKGNEAIATDIESLASDYDIFIYRTSDYASNVYKGQITHDGEKYENYYLNLTDLYDEKIEGEGDDTIGKKMTGAMKDVFDMDGKFYAVPWMNGTMGIMRNVTLWKALGFTDEDVPLTTDQLFALCGRINTAAENSKNYKSAKAFIYSASDEYYTNFMPIWFAQYEGMQRFNQFKEGLDQRGQFTSGIFEYPGIEKMMDAVRTLVHKTNGYQHSASESLSFTDMQGQFLLNEAMFCVNGEWIEIESNSGLFDTEIDFIKAPVISSIIESDRITTIEDDATLRAVIRYVDGTSAQKPSGVSDADIEVIREARECAYTTLGHGHILAGSSYTSKPEWVKSFIKYMYSDEGLQLYYKATHGAKLPARLSDGVQYDPNVTVSDFMKMAGNIPQSSIVVYSMKSRLFTIGGVNKNFTNNVTNVVAKLRDGMTATEIVNYNKNYVKNHWTTIEQQCRVG